MGGASDDLTSNGVSSPVGGLFVEFRVVRCFVCSVPGLIRSS